MWNQAGRKLLPNYLNNAGVPTALDEFENRQRDVREEEEKKVRAQRRGSSAAELACIELLEEAIRMIDPSLGDISLRGVNYLVADSEQILGAWRRTREYRAKEIYFAAKLFVGPFKCGFATYLHEASHLFGAD